METIELLAAADLEPDLADRMRIVMRRRKMNNSEVAEAIDVSVNSVSNWINGNTRPRRRDLAEFARATGAPVEWLETGTAPADAGAEVEPPAGIEPATYSLQGYEIPDTVADLLALWAVDA